MKRLLLALFVAMVISSCATLLLSRPAVVEEYTTKVRVYRWGQQCRVEVVTPTDTISTTASHCTRVPHVLVSP